MAADDPPVATGVARTVALDGLHPLDVRVEAHIGHGLPAFTVLGLSGAVGGQAGARVTAALQARG